MRRKKNKRKRNKKKVKINLKTNRKSRILQSFKMIIRTLKEYERYANMTKRSRSTQNAKVICKSKKIKNITTSLSAA